MILGASSPVLRRRLAIDRRMSWDFPRYSGEPHRRPSRCISRSTTWAVLIPRPSVWTNASAAMRDRKPISGTMPALPAINVLGLSVRMPSPPSTMKSVAALTALTNDPVRPAHVALVAPSAKMMRSRREMMPARSIAASVPAWTMRRGTSTTLPMRALPMTSLTAPAVPDSIDAYRSRVMPRTKRAPRVEAISPLSISVRPRPRRPSSPIKPTLLMKVGSTATMSPTAWRALAPVMGGGARLGSITPPVAT